MINKKEYTYSDDNLAKECLQTSGDSSIMECLGDKAFSYYEEGDCVKALKVYDDIPAEQFDKRTLSDIYNDAYSFSLSCEDESLQIYWTDKFTELSNQLEAVD